MKKGTAPYQVARRLMTSSIVLLSIALSAESPHAQETGAAIVPNHLLLAESRILTDVQPSTELRKLAVSEDQLSPKLRRLRETDGHFRINQTTANGKRYLVNGTNFYLPAESAGEKKDKKPPNNHTSVFKRIVVLNESLFAGVDFNRFTVDEDRSTSERVYFQQYVDGVPVEPSFAEFSFGKATRIFVHYVDDSSAIFSRKAWLSTESLASIGFQRNREVNPHFSAPGKPQGQFEIRFIMELQEYRPVYVHSIGPRNYIIDAIDGKIHYVDAWISGQASPPGRWVG